MTKLPLQQKIYFLSSNVFCFANCNIFWGKRSRLEAFKEKEDTYLPAQLLAKHFLVYELLKPLAKKNFVLNVYESIPFRVFFFVSLNDERV